jgi:hypothetical protein
LHLSLEGLVVGCLRENYPDDVIREINPTIGAKRSRVAEQDGLACVILLSDKLAASASVIPHCQRQQRKSITVSSKPHLG